MGITKSSILVAGNSFSAWPSVNSPTEKVSRILFYVLKLIQNNLVLSSHDVSSGGLITALSEMTIDSDYGVKVSKPKKLLIYLSIFLERIREDIYWKLIQKIFLKLKKY